MELKNWLKYLKPTQGLFAKPALLIDELGREPRPAKHYGTELNVIQFLLQLRYDHRMSDITHLTSNIRPEDVMPMYGDYISDRFREMFNIIHWGGESKR